MMPRRALILIDLQNEFLGQAGNFPLDPQSRLLLLGTLKTLVPTFRQRGGHIIWVLSEYAAPAKDTVAPSQAIAEVSAGDAVENDDDSANDANASDWTLHGTHRGRKPCCMKGLYGSQLPAQVAGLVRKDDSKIVKAYFSSFKETNLLELLTAKGIREIYLSGLLSGRCVLATTLWATTFHPHISTHVVVEALGWRREKSHRNALETMAKNGATLTTAADLAKLPDISGDRGPGDRIGEGDSHLYLDLMEPGSAMEEKLFEILNGEVKWLNMSHRGGPVPRLVAVQGEVAQDGRYALRTQIALITEMLRNSSQFSDLPSSIRSATATSAFQSHCFPHSSRG